MSAIILFCFLPNLNHFFFFQSVAKMIRFKKQNITKTNKKPTPTTTKKPPHIVQIVSPSYKKKCLFWTQSDSH